MCSLLTLFERYKDKKFLLKLVNFLVKDVEITNEETDACSRPLCTSLKFLAYKKKTKTFFYATVQCGRYNVLIFFSHKKLKKPLSKVAHNRPQTFFSQVRPSCPNQPRIDFSCHKYVPRRICSLICG